MIEQTREKLQHRLEELQHCLDEAAEIRALLKAMDALQADGTAGPRQPLHLPAKTRKLQLLGVLRDRQIHRIKELAEALQVTPGRVVQLVNELEEGGTAKRVEGGVEITPDGLEVPEMKITIGSWQKVAAR